MCTQIAHDDESLLRVEEFVDLMRGYEKVAFCAAILRLYGDHESLTPTESAALLRLLNEVLELLEKHRRD